MAPRPSTSPRAVARRVAKLTALQYQLRIELKHVEPLIWRRVLVPENVTLARLHAILLSAMGWGGGHLHEFRIARCRYGIPDEEDWPEDDPLFDERRFRLKGLVESGARRFTYLYDFGDGWEHTIKVEDIVVPQSDAQPIRCIAGENACPPEDVGGPDGYAEFLTAINNPAHEEHSSMLRWAGGTFDPGAFNVADANERLATIKT
jgi:hypothetical protein